MSPREICGGWSRGYMDVSQREERERERELKLKANINSSLQIVEEANDA